MKDSETVAIITIATIGRESPGTIGQNMEAKLDLVKRLKSGYKIISAIPTHTNDIACITYVLEKDK